MSRNSSRSGLPTSILALLVALVVCFSVAAVGAKASINAGGFYMQLQRPSWAPPARVFGPVWTLLYALMAVSAWLVWRRRDNGGTALPLTLFAAQLSLNGLWSWVFFQWHRGFLATVNIALLWLLLAATVWAFWRQHRLAGLLLVPYLAWVSFATALSYAVWQYNPLLLGG